MPNRLSCLTTRLSKIVIALAVANTLVGRCSAATGDARFGMGPPVTDAIVQAAAGATTNTATGPVLATWDSLKTNYHVPAWFMQAKFGITMHWGLYSVPAYHNEWYEKHMYAAFSDWHAQHFGPQDQFGYKDFIPKFTAEKFDADQWVDLVKQSGAQYLMPTCEHHDGFSLWDSALNPYNSMKMGPKLDIMGELAIATRKQGLKFGLCNHSIEHYTFIQPKTGLKTDLDDERFADFYWSKHNDARLQQFLELWVSKNLELIDKYQPDIIWFDNGANARAYDPLKLKVAAYYYNKALQWGKQVTLDTKDHCYLEGAVLNFEKMARGPKDILPGVWEAEETIGSTWGYTADEKFRSPQAIVSLLCDVVSKGGNLLLNLSPAADGTITAPQQTTLLEVGRWLKLNGQAIYGTHSWTQFSDGEVRKGAVAYRYTVKDDSLFAIAQSWPGSEATLTALPASKGAIKSITLLGHDGDLKFSQDAAGLHISMPAEQPCKYAFVFRITGLAMNPAGPATPSVAQSAPAKN